MDFKLFLGRNVRRLTGMIAVTALICIVFIVNPARAADRYVDQGAGGANDGSSWSDAWTTLSAALPSLNNGDILHVMGGGPVYSLANGETDDVPSHTVTADNVEMIGEGLVNVDGAGANGWQKGIAVQGTNFKIHNFAFRNFNYTATDAGIHIDNAVGGDVYDITFENNSFGVLVDAYSGGTVDPVITNNTFLNNDTGIKAYVSDNVSSTVSPTIKQNIIHSSQQYGIQVVTFNSTDVASPGIWNNLIYDTANDVMAAIELDNNAAGSMSPTVRFNTLDGNNTAASEGISVAGATPTISGNIIYDFDIGISTNNDLAGAISYNCFFDNNTDLSTGTWGTGNIVTDPKFMSVGTDWRLQIGSPCIDKITTGTETEDLEHGPGFRPQGPAPAAWDMGCHEKSYWTISTTVTPAGSGSVSGGGGYFDGATATLIPAANSGYAFVEWQGAITGNTVPAVLTVHGNMLVTAVFSAGGPFTLSIDVEPPGAGIVTGAGSYAAGETAVASAQANAGWIFSDWSGSVTSQANPLSIRMDGPKVITAHFVPDHGLTISLPGGTTGSDFRIIPVAVMHPNPTPTNVFGIDPASYDPNFMRIGWWKTVLSRYLEYPFEASTGSGDQGTPTLIYPGWAGWFLFRNPTDLRISGDDPPLEPGPGPTGQGIYYDIEAGWNQVGNPFKYPIYVELIKAVIGGVSRPVKFWVWNNGSYGSLPTDGVLMNNEGGWILAAEAGHLYFDSTPAPPPATRRILEAADGEEEPPPPPEGFGSSGGGGGGGGCFIGVETSGIH